MNVVIHSFFKRSSGSASFFDCILLLYKEFHIIGHESDVPIRLPLFNSAIFSFNYVFSASDRLITDVHVLVQLGIDALA